MSEDYAREKAYTLVAAAIPGTPIMYENQKFTQPKNGAFVKVSVQPNMSARKDIGTNHRIFRHWGVINCVILVPEDTGMKTLTELSEALFLALADRKFAVPGGGSLSFCHAKRANRGTLNGYQNAGVMVEYYMDLPG